jgi:phenylpyruvate tautomerase PptA (4-oxalocrotonate tautomerase family)
MPIVRVDVPHRVSNEVKDELRAGIKDAINTALDPGQQGRHPETCGWIYVSITEAYDKMGDGLPAVTIDKRPGRAQEQNDMVARLIRDVFDRVMGMRDVYVLL